MDDNQSNQQLGQNNRYVAPKTWLVESILATIFCCWPFGVVGIVKAARVESLFREGYHEESHRASQQAKKWTTWSFISGLIIIIFYTAAISILVITDTIGDFPLPSIW